MASNLLEHIPKQSPRMRHLDRSTGICTDHLMTTNRDADYSDTVFLATGYGYRYGLQRIERDDELYGLGNSTTAMYWQYDAGLGRIWNTDPVLKVHESSFATLANNPIFFIDPLGNDKALYNISSGLGITAARKIAEGKTPVYFINEIIEGETVEQICERVQPLVYYNLGSKTPRDAFAIKLGFKPFNALK